MELITHRNGSTVLSKSTIYKASRDIIDIDCRAPQCVTIQGCDVNNVSDHCFKHADIILMHVNARDLRVLDRLPHLQLLAEGKDKTVDVLAVSETWFRNTEEASNYKLNNFEHLASCRSVRLGGGVSLYIHRRWTILEHSCTSSDCDGVQIVRAIIDHNKSFLTVVAFYSRALSCMDTLLDELERALALPTMGALVLLGDANIDLFNVKVASPYIGFMASQGLIRCINKATRPSSGTCIDHIWVGHYPTSFLLKGYVIETAILADHSPIILTIDVGADANVSLSDANNRGSSLRRVFSSENHLFFSRRLQEQDWDSVLHEKDPDAAYCVFECILFGLYEQSFPLRTRVRQNVRPPWFNGTLRKMRRGLDKMHNKYRASSDPALRRNLNFYRRLYRRAVKNCCKAYHSRMHLRLKEKPKALWQHINACIGRKSTKSAYPHSIRLGNQRFTGPAEVAEAFCEHFSKIADHIAAGMASDSGILRDLEVYPALNTEFALGKVSFSDISCAAKTMKTDLKGSITKVPSKIIKQCIGLLLVPLRHIFNQSIKLGRFPNALKETVCMPIYKGKGDRSEPSSYRPIALTPFCAKLFERCVKIQLECHLEQMELLSENQFGFRRKRSTEVALCKMADYIAANCESGHAVFGLYLDVAKAFDCLCHDLLFRLMELAKFDKRSVDWFKSYLGSREIAVSLGDTTSSKRQISRGVPQGSVLGPFLFIFYLNPLLANIEKNCPGVSVIAYADDTTVFLRVRKEAVHETIDLFNKYLTYIYNAFRGFMLDINIGKTKVIIYKSAQCQIEFPTDPFVLNGEVLYTSHCGETLGLTFSSDLRWWDHCSAVSRKCYGIVCALARLRQLGHDRSLLIMLYKALFEPVLFYGAPIWGTTYENVLKKFQTMQNDAIRAIYGLKRRQSVRSIFEQEKILTVVSMAKYKICLLAFKGQTDRIALDIDWKPQPSLQSYSLRSANSNRLLKPICKSTYREHGPKVSFIHIWNSLPVSIRTCRKFSEFKERLRLYLLEN